MSVLADTRKRRRSSGGGKKGAKGKAPAGTASRRLAIDALVRIDEQGAFANLVLPDMLARSELSDAAVEEVESRSLHPGEVRVRVDVFGVSANNISYALFGDMLGYWAYFPVDEARGCVPVWGFAEVVDSESEHLRDGERIFGYLPMADELILSPAEFTRTAFFDASPHRTPLHPWYNRYYRCAGDPLWTAVGEQLQATMWALFMTGWALANQLAETSRTVVVSSASSKTALSLAWTLHHHANDVAVVGLTSPDNVDFTTAAGVYDGVMTYDDLDLDTIDGPVAFVDAAGSPAIKERVHAALGDRLTNSVILGATHQGAGEASGELVGPAPQLFFIPDVAEQAAAVSGVDAYHQAFTEQWRRFLPWIAERLVVETGLGADDILDAYRTVLAGGVGPETAKVLTW